MLSTVTSGAIIGVHGEPVQVEVNTGEMGELRFVLVGLPDAAVKESQDRVFSALTNSSFSTPITRTTINLAPGHIRKEGPMYDLPIALGLLLATQQLTAHNLEDYLIAGELSLSGATRPIKGALALTTLAKKMGKKGVILPPLSAQEASLVEGINVYAADSLQTACKLLSGNHDIKPLVYSKNPNPTLIPDTYECDFKEIKGQKSLRRAIEVAVSGGHNLLMIGPPGSGKSMVAKRIPTIIPQPTTDEFLEILSIQSAAGITIQNQKIHFNRPFRSPHHTISDVGLLGGGSIPGPGEISLAHNGVLFMDELPEFKRTTLEVLRQPLEDGHVSISRSAGKITLPCNFMLVAAMNPCPCGYLGDPQRECRCNSHQIQRYRSRISGPLLDRIDIHIDAPAISIAQLNQSEHGETSHNIKLRVEKTRLIQQERFKHSKANHNSHMSQAELEAHCKLDPQELQLLNQAMEELKLSARAYHRILKVARTIADIDENEKIQSKHLLEAIQYRTLDRNLFY